MTVKNNLLRKFFDENNITQSDFGKKVDVTQSLVGQWLRNERPISVEKALSIESIFKIDASYLCNDVKLVRQQKRPRCIYTGIEKGNSE